MKYKRTGFLGHPESLSGSKSSGCKTNLESEVNSAPSEMFSSSVGSTTSVDSGKAPVESACRAPVRTYELLLQAPTKELGSEIE